MPSETWSEEEILRLLPDLERRKTEHLRICLTRDVQARSVSTGLEDIRLLHNALPEIDLSEISPSTSFLGHEFDMPLIIEGMTGGFPAAEKINARLAEAAERYGLGVSTGSQRVALENPELTQSFKIVREKAPNAFVIANIGVVQIKGEEGVDMAEKCVEMIDADALAIHLNSLQEALQPEGETEFKGGLEGIRRIAEALSVPVIVKETGAGISGRIAKMLEGAGVAAIDVAGAGGTSWAAVEHHRSLLLGDRVLAKAGEVFWDWGIPTALSLLEVSEAVDLPVIASGGLKDGLDMAKALVIGADITGMAYSLLIPASKGVLELDERLKEFLHELKMAMFLTGSRNLEELKRCEFLLSGRLLQWFQSRRSRRGRID